jgi:putative oxidoreductase
MGWLTRTQNDAAMLFARLALGVSMFPHGAQKAMGWFKDPNDMFKTDFDNMSQTVDAFRNFFDMAPWMTYCVIAAELLGSIALVFGFFGRLAAIGIGATMVGAAWKTHLSDGNFKEWWIFDNMGLEGGYHMLAVGICLAILIRGSGALSIDRKLSGPPKL